MDFFISRKNNVSFSGYQDFCVFVKPANFKICDTIVSTAASCKFRLCLFLLNHKSYQNEIWSNTLVCCMTNISNKFLTECWRLETSSRLSYDFIKKTIQQDLAIFNGWHIPFLIVLFKKWNTGILAYLVIE